MAAITTRFPLVDGSASGMGDTFRSGKEFIDRTITDDWGAPPTAYIIEGTNQDGRPVRIVIPYSDTGGIHVTVG